MGQIIIKTPVKEIICYEVETVEEYQEIKIFLDAISSLENPHLTEEDLYDLQCIEKARKEIAEHGTIKWEDAKKILHQ